MMASAQEQEQDYWPRHWEDEEIPSEALRQCVFLAAQSRAEVPVLSSKHNSSFRVNAEKGGLESNWEMD